MQPKTVAYPIFLLIELVRLFMILFTAAPIIRDSLAWYAALPVLCIAPVLYLMLAFNEAGFLLWLPLLAFIKALSIVSFIALSLRLLPDALRFGTSGADNPAMLLPVAGLFILADAVSGVFAYGRYRVLCK